MKKSLLAGLVLASGLGVAAFWAASPDCEGSLCLGNRDGPGASKTEAVPVIAPEDRVTTEDLERIWKEAESEQPEPAGAEPETAPAGQAEAVPETGPEAPEAVPAAQAGTVTPGGQAAFEPAEAPSAEAFGELEDLEDGNFAEDGDFAFEDETPERVDPQLAEARSAAAYAAINEPNDELRAEAIGEVGNRRDGEAVAVLTDVAYSDPVADNRYQALQSLWYSAADGLDGDGAITTALREAANDPDERIAELAEKALKDLAKLEQQRQQEEF